MSHQNAADGTGTPVGGAMSVWDAIRSRRNVRAYDGRPIPAAALGQILEAGRPLAPISRPDRRPFDEVVHWGRW